MAELTPLEARYGRRPADPARTRRRAIVGLVIAVAVVGSFATWVEATRVKLDYVVARYEVTSDQAVEVEFSLDKDADAVAVCRVVAQNRYQEVIGTIDVTIPAGPATARTQQKVTVPTRERAIVGTVQSCRLQG